MKDYYEILGVSKSADDTEIKKAYRTLAKKYHPDVNPGDKKAEEMFKDINSAYAVLSDPEKRARYDQFGPEGVEGGANGGGFSGFSGFSGGGFDFSDIFGDIFGGSSSSRGRQRANSPVDGDDLLARVTISFEEAAFGCKKEIKYSRVEKCKSCGGSGASAGTSVKTCPKCNGSGQLRVQQRTPLGIFQSSNTCDACRGTGRIVDSPCRSCRGTGNISVDKDIEVSIPAGIDNGNRISLRGMGNSGKNGGSDGDLFIEVSVRANQIFKRDGYDIKCDVPISFEEAALGATINVPTLDGYISQNIPEGTQTGTVFSVKGKGIANINGRGKGDLIFRVVIDVPKGLTSEQKDTLRKYADARGTQMSVKRDKLFGKFGNGGRS